jgi:hypothetical protein
MLYAQYGILEDFPRTAFCQLVKRRVSMGSQEPPGFLADIMTS